MKRLLLYVAVVVYAITGYASVSNMSVQTRIFDANCQPPIVGGVIDGYSDGDVLKRGIIVSSTLDNAVYKESENWYDISWYFDLKDYRIIDCTNIGNEQFWCPLKLLKSNCDYYVRAFVVMKDGTVSLGNVEKLHSKSFSRYSGTSDYANVWYAFSKTLFDLVTDEVINPNDGFYYSTNENPTRVKYQKGTSYNTCYKYATEWNYKLWYFHNTNHCDKNKIINMPIMAYSNGKLAIQKNPLDANKSITIYYSINGNYFRPETYTNVYSSPISVSSPSTVYCYAISSDGYISYTNMYNVGNNTINGNDDGNSSLKGQGTWDNPYLIGTATELKMFNEMLMNDNAICGRLIADIVLNQNVLDANYNLNGNGTNFEQWNPHEVKYGYFNGAGHTISGLYINGEKEYVGLFTNVSRVDSLGVIDSYIKGYRHVGGISSWVQKGDDGGAVISNCYFDGVVIATGDKAGGIAAHMGNTYGGGNSNKIVNCYNKGRISGYNHVGGICGSAYSLTNYDDDKIENCYNIGIVSASRTDCGAICGYVNKVVGTKVSATASKCYSLEGSCNKTGQGYDGEHKVKEDFINGTVCSLLNANGGCYHQTVGTDDYPKLFGYSNDSYMDNAFGKVADVIDLGLSVKWASWNIGASKIGDYGGLYGIGDPTGMETTHSISAYHYADGESICGSEYDLATVKWKGNWRLPSFEELEELKNNCSWEYNVVIDGVPGCRATGPNGNSIFIPYAGSRSTSNIEEVVYKGSLASLWSGDLLSTSPKPRYKDLDIFSSGKFQTDGGDIFFGQSIRPVYDAEPITTTIDKIIAKDVAGISGQTIAVSIELDNKTDDFTAYQFDLALPEGIVLATDSKGQYQVTKTNRYEDEAQTVNVSPLGNNTYRIVSFSLSNGKVKGNNGAILDVVLSIADNVNSGTYNGIITNIIFTKSDGTLVKLSDAEFDIIVTKVLMGDTNGDNEVNVADIVEIVNDILGTPSAKFSRDLADMNGDGEINVTDIVKVVSIILYDNSSNTRAKRAAKIRANSDYLSLKGNADGTKTLCLNNQVDYVASQFDIRLADGQQLDGIALNESRCGLHQLVCSKVDRNLYRVMVYSLANESYVGHEGELLNINVSGDGNMKVENILFVTVGQEEIRFSPLYAGTTGINNVKADKKQDVYSLDGRLVQRQSSSNNILVKGIYIINGKKHIVK